MRFDLRKRLFLSFASVIVALTLLGSIVGTYLINRAVVDEAQNRIRLDLRAAWAVYNGELKGIRDVLRLASRIERIRKWIGGRDRESLQALLEEIRLEYGWDFLSLADRAGRVLARGRYPYSSGDDRSRDPVIRRALRGEEVAATQIVPAGVLDLEGENLRKTAYMVFEPTPKAKPRSGSEETAGMVLVAAVPVLGPAQQLLGVIYGGVLLNRRYELVDTTKDVVFKGEQYGGKDLGTVTIFQWDLRIATNVMKTDGNRAIGTRVSTEVYDQVLENGRSWQDRAFVVNDWYITAYDPIRDIEGQIAGILYVGVLERKYNDLRNQIVFAFLGVTLLGTVLVLGTSYLLAEYLARPIRRLVDGAKAISGGDLGHRVEGGRRNDEIGDLTKAFNQMADSLKAREEELQVSNQELKALNQDYLDMLGFVSHELKNTVGVCLTNAYSLRDGILGEVTPLQKRALDGTVRNLEYCEQMIKHYLDLARIEMGELRIEKRCLDLYDDIVLPVLRDFDAEIEAEGAQVTCEFTKGSVQLSADPDLLRIVFENLVGNALKYGKEGGRIVLGATAEGEGYLMRVWNEGPGIPEERLGMLFKKFSRIEKAGGKKGTGLGLFITREIVEKHGGRIWAESREGEWAEFRLVLPGSDTGQAESKAG